jgi:hypothetical protein
VRRFAIWLDAEIVGTVFARSDYSALKKLAADMGLDPNTISGTYRLPLPDNRNIYAVEVH